MQAQYKTYDSYKDSGTEWLGMIPSSWELQSIRAVTELKSQKNQPDLQVLSVYREYGVIQKDSRDDNHNVTSEDTSNYKAVAPGDLVVNKMKAWQGSMGVSEHHGIVSPAYITCKTKSEKVLPRFLHYLLRSQPFISVYNALSYGVRIGQWDMHYEDFKKIALAYPSITEQERIVAFLDQKTAEIDAAIEKKQRLIELLKEQKSILINQAVTKGLNPSAPMKDSGIEWIGQIPAHWEVLPFTKYCISQVDYRGKTPEKTEEGTFLVTAKNIKDGYIDYEISKEFINPKDYEAVMSRGKPQIGDLLFTTEAPLGQAALIDKQDIALAQRIIKFRLQNRLNPTFTKFSVLSHYFQSFVLTLATGSTAQGIKASKLHMLRIIAPPINEQEQIINKIMEFEANINERNAIVGLTIDRLQEFKQTLIAHAVTGKIKV